MEEHKGQAFDPSDLCSISICNVICSIVFGRRYDFADEELLQLVHYFHEIFRLSGGVAILNIFPVLQFLPGDLFGSRRMMQMTEEVLRFVSVHLKKHEQSLDTENPRDYIDRLLCQAIHKRPNKSADVFTGICRTFGFV